MTDINLDQELSEIFDSSPTETEKIVELPSKGVFYNSKVSSVKIKPLLFEDEKALISARKNKEDILNAILQRCIIGVDSNFLSNLLPIDKIFIMIKLREISFSKNYKANIVCPNCREQYEVVLGIDEIPINYYDKEGSDPIEITLPTLKKTAKVKVLRTKDEHLFKSEEGLNANLWRNIVELGGKTNHLVISKALEKMSLVDIKLIVDTITLQGYGVDPKFEYVCSDEGCQYRGILDIPLSEDFFTLSSLGKEI